MIKHIPNILTIIRFIFIPSIIISLSYDNYLLALILFTLSSLTDILDGKIARKYNAISDFGKLMDPLADKLTQLSVLLTLSIKNIIPWWIVVVLVLKETVMIAGASFLYGKSLVVSSKWYGKLTTVLLYIAVVSSCIIKIYDFYRFDIYIYALAVLFALFSLIKYFMYFYGKGYLPNKEELKKQSKTVPEKKSK